MATRDANPGTSPPVEGTLDFDDETLRGWCKTQTNRLKHLRPGANIES